MEKSRILFVFLILNLLIFSSVIFPSNLIPADNPYIQYYGRWDFSNPLAPTHSWPGVYIFAKFEGTSIGIRTDDNACYYNVFIDDTSFSIFHGNLGYLANYTLASGLPDGNHTILITKRGETSWTRFTFGGFILDDGKNLLPPPGKPVRKIEFIGDSYTSASGNEWTATDAAPNASYDNIYKGFGPILARHYGAQYNMTSRGGFGLILDWQGNYSNNIPDYFDRTLFYAPQPKWDFSQWIPDLVVICLGLNDYNGWGGYTGPVPKDNGDYFKKRYHDFISVIIDVYPGAKILAVAANDVTWIKTQASEVAAEENAIGNTNVFYTYFPYYNGEYINNGHPNLSAHQKIADKLIEAIDEINAWEPYVDTIPPAFINLPLTPFTATSSPYLLRIETNSYATVRYSTEDKPYDQMEYEFTSTGTRLHSVSLDCEQNQNYTYYLRAVDSYGNAANSSAIIQFYVDTSKTFLNWKSPEYDHSGWQFGSAPLGNDGPANNFTEIAPGISGYFRKVINFENAEDIKDLRLHIKGHDGAVIYLNGKQVSRMNMPTSSEVLFNTYAVKTRTLDDSLVLNSFNGLNYLQNGENVFAVEVHSRYSLNPDLSFYAKIYDKEGAVYSDFISDWYYYDGAIPPDQLVDKPADVDFGNDNIPSKIFLYQNYPNPFNPATKIRFTIPQNPPSSPFYQRGESGGLAVSLRIYDILGKEVATLVNEEKPAGEYEVEFQTGAALASGIYFYQLKVGSVYIRTKKMALLK
jgi:lysophospholipase L1-like esterase